MSKITIKCIKCGSTSFVKNGTVFGTQRFLCKSCGYQFTKGAPAGKSIFVKLIAHSLFLSGLSMRAVGPIVGVTVQSVSRWLKKWHPTYMREIGAKSQISNTNKKELLSHLNLDEDDEIMVISTPLPSGATIHSVIQIPVGIKKSLKE